MKQLHTLYRDILNTGISCDDRTGVGTLAIFGETIKFDLTEGFPAVTTKKLAWKSVISELLWFLRGSTNVNDLRAILYGEENRFNFTKKTIWDDNFNAQGVALGYTDGELGPVYGAQWRYRKDVVVHYKEVVNSDQKLQKMLVDQKYTLTSYDEKTDIATYSRVIDQIRNLVDRAKSNPDCRRLIVSAWNPGEQHLMALPPCHYGFQLRIMGDRISLIWQQRSVDSFLGLPFNIASYAALLAIFGRILDKTPHQLIGQLGDTHIYKNHTKQVIEQICRDPYQLPELWINPDLKTLDDFLEKATVDDFKLVGYQHHPALTAPMAV